MTKKRIDAEPAAEVKTDVWSPSVGDAVIYRGSRHYTHPDAITGPICKGGRAKIVDIQLTECRHPYHIVADPGGGGTVNGWVDRQGLIPAK